VTFEMMQAEGVFARLVELIRSPNVQQDTRLHQMLMELMYESSRIQRLSWEDLSASTISQDPVTAIVGLTSDSVR
jgi:hypothetical protein